MGPQEKGGRKSNKQVSPGGQLEISPKEGLQEPENSALELPTPGGARAFTHQPCLPLRLLPAEILILGAHSLSQ